MRSPTQRRRTVRAATKVHGSITQRGNPRWGRDADGVADAAVRNSRCLLRGARHGPQHCPSRRSREAQCRSRPSERSSGGFAKAISAAACALASATRKNRRGRSRGRYRGEFRAQERQGRANLPAFGRHKASKRAGVASAAATLVAEIKPLEHYTYVKFKDQVLIVNPMTRVIVDMFPQS